jgi:hypothetical protein
LFLRIKANISDMSSINYTESFREFQSEALNQAEEIKGDPSGPAFFNRKYLTGIMDSDQSLEATLDCTNSMYSCLENAYELAVDDKHEAAKENIHAARYGSAWIDHEGVTKSYEVIAHEIEEKLIPDEAHN